MHGAVRRKPCGPQKRTGLGIQAGMRGMADAFVGPLVCSSVVFLWCFGFSVVLLFFVVVLLFFFLQGAVMLFFFSLFFFSFFFFFGYLFIR